MWTLTIKSLLFSNLNCKIDKNVSLICILWHDCSLEIQRFLTDSLFVLHKQDLKAKQARGAKKRNWALLLIRKRCSPVCFEMLFFPPISSPQKNQLILFYSSKKTNPEITRGFSAALRKLRKIYKPQGSLTQASLLELCDSIIHNPIWLRGVIFLCRHFWDTDVCVRSSTEHVRPARIDHVHAAAHTLPRTLHVHVHCHCAEQQWPRCWEVASVCWCKMANCSAICPWMNV